MTDEPIRLNCDAIDCTPITIDWQESLGDDAEGWKAYEAFVCDGCGREVVSSSLGECEHRDLEPEITVTDEDGDEDEQRNRCRNTLVNEGPQMSYWYPVRIDDCEDAARLIKDLPLCVVEFEGGKTGLALTGGGMDLSWEICEAFIAIGYHPPLHFCDLPRMSPTPKSQAIIAACMETCRIAESWAAGKRERLEEMAVRYDEQLKVTAS